MLGPQTSIYSNYLVRAYRGPGDQLDPRWDDLFAGWHLDETSGTRADVLGTYDLTDNNTVGVSPRGPSGTVASFVAADSEYLSSDAASLDPAIAYSFWFKRNAAGNFPAFEGVVVRDVAARGIEVFGFSGQTKLTYGVHESDGNEVTALYSVTVDNTNWHLAHVWADTADSKLWFQLDANTAESVAFDGTLLANPGALLVGGWPGVGFFDGQVGKVGVWSRMLTAQERTSLFNSGNGKSYADLTDDEKVDLISYWNLDEASGDRTDAHGSNTLTDNNTVGSATAVAGAMHNAAASFLAANSESLSTTNFVLDFSLGVTFCWWQRRNTNDPALCSTMFYGNLLFYGEPNDGAIFHTTDGAGALVNNCYVYDDSGPASIGLASATSDVWEFLVIAYDPATKKLKASRNGAALTTSAGTLTNHPVMATNNLLVVGAQVASNLPANFSSAKIDEIYVFNVLKDDAWVADMYNAGAGRFYPN